MSHLFCQPLSGFFDRADSHSLSQFLNPSQYHLTGSPYTCNLFHSSLACILSSFWDRTAWTTRPWITISGVIPAQTYFPTSFSPIKRLLLRKPRPEAIHLILAHRALLRPISKTLRKQVALLTFNPNGSLQVFLHLRNRQASNWTLSNSSTPRKLMIISFVRSVIIRSRRPCNYAVSTSSVELVCSKH